MRKQLSDKSFYQARNMLSNKKTICQHVQMVAWVNWFAKMD